jgi:hypothetical protein
LFLCIHLANNTADCDVGFAVSFELGDALPAKTGGKSGIAYLRLSGNISTE